MNWVDFLIIGILIFFAASGFGRSFIWEVYELLTFVLAFFLSLKFYNLVAGNLETIFNLPHSLSNVLGFILVWFVIETITAILATGIIIPLKAKLKFSILNPLSVIPSFLKGLIFVAILLILVATFPIQPTLKKEVQNSKIGSQILAKTYQLESPLKNIFGGLANDTLTFLTIKPQGNQSVNLGFKTDNFYFDKQSEDRMVELVNKERLNRGISALAFDPKLREVARYHSSDMFNRGYFAHYSPEGYDVAARANQFGVSYIVLGENLAYAPNLDLAHNGLMNSPGHRANILSSDFKKVGIGVANASEYGVMFTQVFTN